MSPSGTIMIQVFWRQGYGDFCEAASVCGFTDDGPARRIVRLAIPGGLGRCPQLRLDPADMPGIAQLFGLRLLHPDGATLWEWNGQAATLAALPHSHMTVLQGIGEAGVFLYFTGNDSTLLLPEYDEPDRLSETGGCIELDFAWRGTISQQFSGPR